MKTQAQVRGVRTREARSMMTSLDHLQPNVKCWLPFGSYNITVLTKNATVVLLSPRYADDLMFNL